MTVTVEASREARRDVQSILESYESDVDKALAVVSRLEAAFADGALIQTNEMQEALAELADVLPFAANPDDHGAAAATRAVTKTLGELVGQQDDPRFVFVIEDELHADELGQFASFEQAVAEIRRIALVPWGTPPNIVPCAGGMTSCERHYEIREFDSRAKPWKMTQRIDAARIEANGERWVADFGPILQP
jgi:hypothetical protein